MNDTQSQRIERKLDQILRYLGLILTIEVRIMADIDDLEAEVAATTAGEDSAIVLLNGILDRLDQAGLDPIRFAAVIASLRAKKDALAAAVAAVPPRPA